MPFHTNNSGFISGDGTRRYGTNLHTPGRRATSGTGKLSAQAERMITNAVERQLHGDDDGLTVNARTDTPLRRRGLVERVQAKHREQAASKAKQPKANKRPDTQPLKPRGLVR